MSKIRGTVVGLKEFLFNVETKVSIEYNEERYPVITLKAGRTLCIPNYQREIRWGKENLFTLINDILHGEKFLGNIILSKKQNSVDYEIIDGQQRIVSLIMLVSYLKQNYSTELTDIGEVVKLSLNCFDKYDKFQSNAYSLEKLADDVKIQIQESDKFDQIPVLENLYKSIIASKMIDNISKARTFLKNLCKCTINVIASDNDDIQMCTEYYIDVNLKGIKLDTEDIFKGYLFSYDTSDSIRDLWVELKQSWFSFNIACNNDKKKTIYPLMKIIEHYIFCNILSQPLYNGVKINDDFTLVEACDVEGNRYYAGDHIIKVVNNNTIMENLIKDVNDYIAIMKCIRETTGICPKVNGLLNKVDSSKKDVFNNFIKKILLDKTLITPKSLIMKYFFASLKKQSSTKRDQECISAIYFYATVFMLFDEKKNTDSIKEILRSDDYYGKTIKCAKNYFADRNLHDSKIRAITRWNSNFDNEDLKYKCKSLATIYNFFSIIDDKIVFVENSNFTVKSFLNDEDTYSIEHFIVSESENILYGENFDYPIPEDIKQYHKYIFNFIFIPGDLNNNVLKNHSIKQKLDKIREGDYLAQIKCAYSKKVIEIATNTFVHEPEVLSLSSIEKDNLENYWLIQFGKQYNLYLSSLLDAIIAKFASESGYENNNMLRSAKKYKGA